MRELIQRRVHIDWSQVVPGSGLSDNEEVDETRLSIPGVL